MTTPCWRPCCATTAGRRPTPPAKAEALGVFQARQRVRRVARWAGGLAALALAAAFTAHWLAGPAAPPPQLLAHPNGRAAAGETGKSKIFD